jgi:ADP-heptose:LPS heptosyltransferase
MQKKTPKHILVIRLSAMGDVAMTVPVLSAFRAQYPHVKVTLLTRKFFTPFFRDLPNVSVFHADVKGEHKGFFGLFKLSKELKKLNIDAIADVHNVLRTKILKLFLFGKQCIQVDKGRAEKNALVSGQKFEQLKTTHQRYADVFEKLGFEIDISNPSFPEPVVLSQNILKLTDNKLNKWIGIAPFAAHESKMYPLDLMETVIETLSKKHKILLFGGGEQEVIQLNKFQNKFSNVINLAGKLTFNEELDVVSNLDVMLSMDSGNAHIAAMFGIKVITLWGVTHPFAGFYPFHQDLDNALLADRKQYPKIPTSVYGNKCPEGYQNAMQTILPEHVISKINKVLK